jgi:hypothetical protein
MKLLASRFPGRLVLLAVLVLGLVGFGVAYRLSSRADQESAGLEVVDSRTSARAAVVSACESSGRTLSGDVNDLQIEGQFAQATAICRDGGSTSMQPTFFTLKLKEGAWMLLQQGTEPPSAAHPPDPGLPARFASGDQ